MESLRAIATDHSSQDLENHFVPLVKRLSQGMDSFTVTFHCNLQIKQDAC